MISTCLTTRTRVVVLKIKKISKIFSFIIKYLIHNTVQLLNILHNILPGLGLGLAVGVCVAAVVVVLICVVVVGISCVVVVVVVVRYGVEIR